MPAQTGDSNTVQSVQARERKKTAKAPTETTVATAPHAVPSENSIRPSGRLKAKPAAGDEQDRRGPATDRKDEPRKESEPPPRRESPGPAAAQDADAEAAAVPEEIRRRFVQVGNKYYFADGAQAFTDRGQRLTTPSENTEVIKSLVSIAQARGWSDITVKGTERFRKEAWFAARLVGLEVRGYQPTEFEQGHVIRTVARERDKGSPAAAAAGSASSAEDEHRRREPAASQNSGAVSRDGRDKMLTGKLVDYGRAPYHHDPHEAMSYFVKIETSRGDRTIWGVDLERAIKESLTRPQIGDDIGLRAARQDAVTVKTHERDAAGKVVAEKDLATHRNRWIVEKRGFFESRAEAARTLRDPAVDPKQGVKHHPELVGTYLQVHAAELAARRFRDPEDQQKFVAQVRSALADSVARGEPLPAVRLRDRSAERPAGRSPPPREREQAQGRS
jgi:putative DNA primase/helicase